MTDQENKLTAKYKGMTEQLRLINTDEEVEKVEACNARILWGTVKYAEGSEAGYDAIFKRVVPTQLELVHQSPIFGRGGDYASRFIQNRVIGDPEHEIYGRLRRVKGNPTYLKQEGTDARGYLGGFTEIVANNNGRIADAVACWQFRISVPELLKSRTLFFDPECTYSSREYKKLYVVFGGIPFQAVTKAQIKIIEPGKINVTQTLE